MKVSKCVHYLRKTKVYFEILTKIIFAYMVKNLREAEIKWSEIVKFDLAVKLLYQYMIKHNAYAPVSKTLSREVRTCIKIFQTKNTNPYDHIPYF